jgi:hypothetical protein
MSVMPESSSWLVRLECVPAVEPERLAGEPADLLASVFAEPPE